jgi:hypothetical protein
MALATPRANPALLIKISTAAMPAAWNMVDMARGTNPPTHIFGFSMGFLLTIGSYWILRTNIYPYNKACFYISILRNEPGWESRSSIGESWIGGIIQWFGSPQQTIQWLNEVSSFVKWLAYDRAAPPQIQGGELGKSRLANWHNHKSWSKPVQCRHGRANPLMDRKVVGVVFFGMVGCNVCSGHLTTTAGCGVVECSCSCSRSCSVL